MKRTLAATALVLLVLTSGCLGFIQGDEPLAFDAAPATVDDATLDETGYVSENVTDVTLNQTVEFRGHEREVRVTNWNAMYTKSHDMPGMGEQSAAQFITFTTPQFDIIGHSLNPVGNMSNEELLEVALSEETAITNVTTVENERVTILDNEANVTKFRATVDASGEYLISYEQDIFIHVTKVAHGGDYVVAVGIYPAQLDEEQNVLTLMKGLDHDE